MKKSAFLVACSIGLTTIFYLLSFFLLPPPPPDASIIGLLALVSIGVVWATTSIFQRIRKRRNTKVSGKTLALAVLACTAAMLCGCAKNNLRKQTAPIIGQLNELDDRVAQNSRDIKDIDARAQAGIQKAQATAETAYQAAQAAKAAATAQQPQQQLSGSANRATGYSLWKTGAYEDSGYGLYSYVLLSHKPSATEKFKYKFFLEAFLRLPDSSGLGESLPQGQINITYIPVLLTSTDWQTLSVEEQAEFVLNHYDYARAVAILSQLQGGTNSGPSIASASKPLSQNPHQRPVLFQNLSSAQPDLMDAYVDGFVKQVARKNFSEASTLESFQLPLRNLLEVTATGLGLSKDAVKSWVTFFK
jgi:hypothetical protein